MFAKEANFAWGMGSRISVLVMKKAADVLGVKLLLRERRDCKRRIILQISSRLPNGLCRPTSDLE
jgi:hypothetical protein